MVTHDDGAPCRDAGLVRGEGSASLVTKVPQPHARAQKSRSQMSDPSADHDERLANAEPLERARQRLGAVVARRGRRAPTGDVQLLRGSSIVERLSGSATVAAIARRG